MTKALFTSICRRCRSHLRLQVASRRAGFSSTAASPAEADGTRIPPRASPSTIQPRRGPSEQVTRLAALASSESSTRPSAAIPVNEPYHLNVYAHKHNTHITFTEPSRDVILSYSGGNIGLRKAQRGSFDAAYQLAAYSFRKMAEKSWRIGGKNTARGSVGGIPSITLTDPEVRRRGLEVILRGYGPGREAFQKAMLGAEGRVVKALVKKVTDGTRLKFGGVRSRAVRRLG